MGQLTFVCFQKCYSVIKIHLFLSDKAMWQGLYGDKAKPKRIKCD